MKRSVFKEFAPVSADDEHFLRRKQRNFTDYEQEILKYFYEDVDSPKASKWLENGNMLTNNFYMYFVTPIEAETVTFSDGTSEEYFRPYNRDQEEFGYVINQVIEDFPELVSELRQTYRISNKAFEFLYSRPVQDVVDFQLDTAELEQSTKTTQKMAADYLYETATRLFDITAPRMQAEGFSPLQAVI